MWHTTQLPSTSTTTSACTDAESRKVKELSHNGGITEEYYWSQTKVKTVHWFVQWWCLSSKRKAHRWSQNENDCFLNPNKCVCDSRLLPFCCQITSLWIYVWTLENTKPHPSYISMSILCWEATVSSAGLSLIPDMTLLWPLQRLTKLPTVLYGSHRGSHNCTHLQISVYNIPYLQSPTNARRILMARIKYAGSD